MCSLVRFSSISSKVLLYCKLASPGNCIKVSLALQIITIARFASNTVTVAVFCNKIIRMSIAKKEEAWHGRSYECLSYSYYLWLQLNTYTESVG